VPGTLAVNVNDSLWLVWLAKIGQPQAPVPACHRAPPGGWSYPPIGCAVTVTRSPTSEPLGMLSQAPGSVLDVMPVPGGTPFDPWKIGKFGPGLNDVRS